MMTDGIVTKFVLWVILITTQHTQDFNTLGSFSTKDFCLMSERKLQTVLIPNAVAICQPEDWLPPSNGARFE